MASNKEAAAFVQRPVTSRMSFDDAAAWLRTHEELRPEHRVDGQ